MATRRRSTSTLINDFSLAVQAAKTYAKDLPVQAISIAKALDGAHADLLLLNHLQEKAKLEQKQATNRMMAALKEASSKRAQVIRFAEAAFGPRDPRIKAFRPATEGSIRGPRKTKHANS